MIIHDVMRAHALIVYAVRLYLNLYALLVRKGRKAH